jgi:hypothetical protein
MLIGLRIGIVPNVAFCASSMEGRGGDRSVNGGVPDPEDVLPLFGARTPIRSTSLAAAGNFEVGARVLSGYDMG